MSTGVYITGAGVISPIGAGLEQFERALYAGASGAGASEVLASALGGSPAACEVRGFAPQTWLGNKGIRVLDRTARLLCVAAHMALTGVRDTAASDQPLIEVSTGLVCGTMFGSLHSIVSFDWSGLEDGVNLVNPMDFPNTVINSAAGQAGIRFRLGGINSTVCAAQCSGLYALHYAAESLRLQRADLLLAGGAEELSAESYLGFCKNGWLSEAAAAPLAPRAAGMMLGEGAALLALSRKNTPGALAEISGFGAAHDASAILEFSADAAGAADAISLSLESAGIGPRQIGCIVSGAGGSRAGDRAELAALRRIFGARLESTPLLAPKAALGETLGAGGAFAALCAALALKNQMLPPTAAGDGGPGLSLSGEAQPVSGEYALITASGCDGNNAAMVLRRCS